MNVAFYVSGNASRLRKVLALADEDLIRSTKLIFSDDRKNEDLKTVAASLGVDYQCMHFKDIVKTAKSKSLIMSDMLLGLLKKHKVDYCFSFGAHLLVGDLLREYEYRIINFHPSVLPMFPGISAIDQAVEATANLLGNTAHFIDAGIDTGPIIMQNVISGKLFSPDNYDIVLDHQLPMLKQIFRWLNDGRLQVEGNKVVIEGANYYQPAFFPALEQEQ